MTLLLLACVHRPSVDEAAPVAEPLDGAAVEWFDLDGVDRIDLVESCLERCPRDEAGVTVASLTTWSVHWDWVRAAGEPCEIADATVETAVTVQLPRWAAPAEADPALVAEWDGWHARLRYHEQGHVDVVRGFADAAEARLRDAGCDGAQEEGARILAGLRAAQHEYDAATGSGHTQGARFWTGG